MSDDEWDSPAVDSKPVKPSKPAVKDSWDGEDESDEEEAPPAKSPPTSTTAPASKSPTASAAATENGGSVKIAAAENSIDRLNPVTMIEFETLRNNVESKLAPLSSSPYYNGFVEDLIRELCTALPPESLKKINSGLTMIINEKTAAQKPKSKKNKKGPSVKMDRGLDIEDDAVYDDFDDL